MEISSHNSQNNVMECGWDGGDCVEWNEKYPNCDNIEWWLGNGYCDSEWNTPECGFDDGSCNEDGSKVRENIPSALCLIHGILEMDFVI